ncbi:MAG: hypothetical protein ABIZ34_04215, partial [Candidatus Limnocylindrales bacterium]
IPDLGVFLIALVPTPDWVSDDMIRLVMLAIVVILPLAIGGALLWLMPADRRPKGLGLLVGVARGYPVAAAMALIVIFLGIVATYRKVISLVRRWEEAHIVVVAKPGRYDELVDALRDSLQAVGLRVERRAAPATLSAPARLLGLAAGGGLGHLVPDHLWRLVAKDLDVLIHTSDIVVGGKKELVARARAALSTRLTWAPAYLTLSAEAQKVEDKIAEAADGGEAGLTDRLRVIDETLASVVIEYDEWETLYRMRLQVERDIRGPGAADGGATSTSPQDLVTADMQRQGSLPAPRNDSGGRRPRLAEWAIAGAAVALLLADVVLQVFGRGDPATRR